MKDEKYLLEVGNRIRDRRKSLGLTQRECADHLGITEAGFAHFEKGRRDIGRDKIEKLAEVLNVKPGYLMGWSDIYGNITYGEPKNPVEEGIKSATKEQLMHYMTIIMEELKKRG